MGDVIAIKGGHVVDGLGHPPSRADVWIEEGRIARVGDSGPMRRADWTVDASGCVVAPGFIDMHSHSDFTLLANPRAESKVRQGVTTEVIGNCGGSAAPAMGLVEESISENSRQYDLDLNWRTFDEYLCRLQEGVAVNIVALVGHGTVRQCVMDLEDRSPTRIELEEMKDLVDDAMAHGAFGLSSGLVYPPGRYAETDELIDLCRVVARHGGLYASHIRGERETIVEALREAIEIGERAGVQVQISHHPAKIGAWGMSPITLKMMDDAARRGVDVTCDLHPYMAGSTGLNAILPPWAQEGGPSKIVERLGDTETRAKIRRDMIEEKVPGPGPCGLVKRSMWDKIVVSSYVDGAIVGRNLKEIADGRGVHPFDAFFDLLLRSNAAGSIVGFYYNEGDIRDVLRHPRSMIGSDGYALAPYGVLGRGRNHPRSYGTFPMVFRKYVRGESRPELFYDEGASLLTLEEVVMKMTSFPAKKLGLSDRGVIRVGGWADIVVFDPIAISDSATYIEPYTYPTGVSHVFVNGVQVIRDGEHTGDLPGKPLRHISPDYPNPS